MGLLDTIRDVTRDSQMKELHRAIGEFAVAFEQMNGEIWACIMWQLQAAGLKDQSIAQILLAKQTADPLRELLKSLIGHMRPANPAEEKIIKNLFARHLTITKERNDYLHGIWHIGWGNEQTVDWSVATGYKLDRKKEGTNVKVFSFKVDDFETLTIEANALNQLFRRLSGCFTGPFAVEKNLAFDDDGKVIELKASVASDDG